MGAFITVLLGFMISLQSLTIALLFKLVARVSWLEGEFQQMQRVYGLKIASEKDDRVKLLGRVHRNRFRRRAHLGRDGKAVRILLYGEHLVLWSDRQQGDLHPPHKLHGGSGNHVYR